MSGAPRTYDSKECYVQVPVTGWLEAINSHPRLGDRTAVDTKRHESKTEFQVETAAEQDKLLAGGTKFRAMIREWNQKYEAKFGHIFLLHARGKSPEQVLRCIQERYANTNCKFVFRKL